MRLFFTISLFLCLQWSAFSQNFPYKLNRAHIAETMSQYPCEFEVYIKDNRPSNCTFDNTFYMYPVYMEEFNHKEDLPNNWRFTMDYIGDDDYGDSGNGKTWLGEAYNIYHNIYTTGGYGYLEWKKELAEDKHFDPNDASKVKTYDFTGAFLSSFFRLRQGVFEAKIKLPDNPYFFPAYWLLNNQEIDIFEFHDEHIATGNTCDTYHHMQMNIHGYIDGNLSTNYSNGKDVNGNPMTHCNRNRKFSVPDGSPSPNFFLTDHIYKCVWTDYRIEIYLDGTLVGWATKYYDGPFRPPGTCHYGAADGWIPDDSRDCNYMNNEDECATKYWKPTPTFLHPFDGHWECLTYKTVKKDMTFPETHIPMQLIISNTLKDLTPGGYEGLKNGWNGFSLDNKRIAIDWIKIYQPVLCSNPRYIYNKNDYLNSTGNTNFLSGSVIQVGNSVGSSITYTEPENFPIHILASDEIKFFDELAFEEGTFLRAEIIDCGGGFNQFQRTTSTGEKLYLTDEEIAEIEKRQNDSLMKYDPAFRDSVVAWQKTHAYEEIIETKSEVDNGAIKIFPNPATEVLYISMTEEDYFDLHTIEIIDNLGRSFFIEKNNILNISELMEGFYSIRFTFTHGFVVVKNFIKK